MHCFSKLFYFIISITLALNICSAHAAEVKPMSKGYEAERLYKNFGSAVYQIQVIDTTSDKKTSIGSGFQFSTEGLIATNYHVVAEAIQESKNNRIEFSDYKDNKGKLTVIIADVINDLAILKMEKPGTSFIPLSKSHPAKGSKLFSIGNPHDIGFTIIEGTYNGLSKESFIDKIHFSGSLNPGMSGGPAINNAGEVIGVNVATAGNQISFLIPIKNLAALIAKYKKHPDNYNFVKNADHEIEQQLLESQEKKLAILLNKPWGNFNFGPVSVPGQIDKALKCWGGAAHKEKDKYKLFYSTCSSKDHIFLNREFDTGMIGYKYSQTHGKDDINLLQFYNFYEKQFNYPEGDYKNAKEDDVTNFKCNNSFIDLAKLKWKYSFCLRRYKKYPKIFDMHLYLAKLGAVKNGFTATIVAQGISEENSLKFSKKFIESIKTPQKTLRGVK